MEGNLRFIPKTRKAFPYLSHQQVNNRGFLILWVSLQNPKRAQPVASMRRNQGRRWILCPEGEGCGEMRRGRPPNSLPEFLDFANFLRRPFYARKQQLWVLLFFGQATQEASQGGCPGWATISIAGCRPKRSQGDLYGRKEFHAGMCCKAASTFALDNCFLAGPQTAKVTPVDPFVFAHSRYKCFTPRRAGRVELHSRDCPSRKNSPAQQHEAVCVCFAVCGSPVWGWFKRTGNCPFPFWHISTCTLPIRS